MFDWVKCELETTKESRQIDDMDLTLIPFMKPHLSKYMHKKFKKKSEASRRSADDIRRVAVELYGCKMAKEGCINTWSPICFYSH